MFFRNFEKKQTMLTRAEILQYLTENKTFFSKNFGISKIAIFGSFARGEQNETSDIDILISMNPETDHIFERIIRWIFFIGILFLIGIIITFWIKKIKNK